MYKIVSAKSFERSLKRLERSGMFKPSTRRKFNEIVNLLASDKALPKGYEDHVLKGEYEGYRECHIKGDLLLVYQKREKELILVLVDLGSHSYLFG